jgi:hypothetical protein
MSDILARSARSGVSEVPRQGHEDTDDTGAVEGQRLAASSKELAANLPLYPVRFFSVTFISMPAGIALGILVARAFSGMGALGLEDADVLIAPVLWLGLTLESAMLATLLAIGLASAATQRFPAFQAKLGNMTESAGRFSRRGMEGVVAGYEKIRSLAGRRRRDPDEG